MATRPGLGLNTNNLPTLRENEASATASPARGKMMKDELLKKLRPPPLVHSWVFWHDRSNRGGPNASNPDSYEDRLKLFCEVSDLKEFWQMFNNFNVTTLQMRDSVHFFHKGVKPIWEDPRNAKGGCWTFRVQKENAVEFWKELNLMAIGEQLQEAVKTNRQSFNDDICGISLSVRFGSYLISIWNRDADNQAGIAKLKEAIFAEITQDLLPKTEDKYFYKKHSEHAAFNKGAEQAK